MDILHTVILSIVEGISEFLPISSTGHLILTSSLLGIPESDFHKSFEIIIQLGAILAVVALYWRDLFTIETIKKLVVGFIPTGIIGLALYKVVKTYLLGNETVVVAALFLGGIALIAFEYLLTEQETDTKTLHDITYTQSALVGLCQALAIIPGVSRSAATILGGRALGISRVAITEFSFLLAVPTMAAATGLDILKSAGTWNAQEFSTLAIGFVLSFIVAFGSIKWLLSYVRSHTFIGFGIYRIIVALVFYFVVLR